MYVCALHWVIVCQLCFSLITGTLTALEIFLTASTGPEGGSINDGTWKSAIYGFADSGKLRSLRKKFGHKPLPVVGSKIKRVPCSTAMRFSSMQFRSWEPTPRWSRDLSDFYWRNTRKHLPALCHRRSAGLYRPPDTGLPPGAAVLAVSGGLGRLRSQRTLLGSCQRHTGP
uniref:Uncharacterized protein n=1 Tax=Hucho hucho TaxID=62062 RepID=A0A4W5MQ24_9TELE